VKFLSSRALALLAACAALIVHSSAAGGASWTRVSGGVPGGTTLAVAVDPARPNTLVAAAGAGLFRSPNRGARWALRARVAAPSQILAAGPGTFYFVEGDSRRRVWKSSDAGLTWALANLGWAQPSSLSADPLAPDTLYILYNFYVFPFDIHNDPVIYRSQDGGANWAPLADLPDACSAFDIAVGRTSAAPAVLYFSGSRPGGTECRASVWRSQDGGTSWTEAAAGLPGIAVELAVDPRDSRIVYARLGDNLNGLLWRSTNSGASWQVSGLRQRSIDKLAVSPAGTVWVSIQRKVYRSTDFGATWQQRGTLTASIFGFAFDPVDPDRVYAATGSGVWVLEDKP